MKDVEEHRALEGRNPALALVVGLGPLLVVAFLYLASPRGFGGGLY